MISTDLRNLTASLKAYAHVGILREPFIHIFLKRLRDLADRVEALERAQVGAPARRDTAQLELIEGGKR
ncbi:hypothetical protein QMT40_003012 [Parvibaculaceae bacterium PLY_AMNH_Bact1]|nr:hypothetical protein QMT40_003012 [Parvibaculaceae bacterium PLY_AMNH_Bact1]